MLKIGAFSKLTQVSIRMLRHYDEMGLLPPAYIDQATGYRFYKADQLPQLYRILALQDLGFSLKQITKLLEQSLSLEQLRGMLLQKQAELEDHIQTEQERLARASARLQLIETDGKSYDVDVVIKDVQEKWVASVRDKITSYHTVGYLFDRMFASLPQSAIANVPAVIWHNDSFVDSDNIDAEALMYLPEPIASNGEAKIYQLSGAKMASLVHHGAFMTLPFAYDRLVRWLDASGYQIDGANREIYLHYSLPPRQDDDSYVTEIQFPIQPIKDKK